MYSIKLFIVFAMTAFYFAVVLGCVRFDSFVTDGCVCHAVFERIRNDRLLISPILCYLIHSESGDTCLSVLYQQLYLNTGLSYSLLFFIPSVSHHCNSYTFEEHFAAAILDKAECRGIMDKINGEVSQTPYTTKGYAR